MIFSSKSKPELALLLDVQSSVVRSALVLFQAKSKPIFIYTHTSIIPFKPHVNSGYLVKVTLHAITSAIEAALKELSTRKSSGALDSLPSKISHVHYILSSPWIVSQAKTLHISFPKNIKVTQDKLRPFLAEERKKLTGDADDLITIEEKVFDVCLNGYSVPNWQGRVVKDLEISFVISVAGAKLIKSFQDNAHRATPTNNVFFHSSLLLQNMGIQKVLPTNSDYTLIHIHGELTDVVVIHKHSCVFFGSFPLGINGIIRKIANATKTDILSAESSLTLFMNKQLDPAHASSTQKIITDISHGWVADLTKLTTHAHIPLSSLNEIIISAHSHDEYFLQLIKKYKPKSDVVLLSIDHIKERVTFSPQTEKLRIMGLCASAIHS